MTYGLGTTTYGLMSAWAPGIIFKLGNGDSESLSLFSLTAARLSSVRTTLLCMQLHAAGAQVGQGGTDGCCAQGHTSSNGRGRI